MSYFLPFLTRNRLYKLTYFYDFFEVGTYHLKFLTRHDIFQMHQHTLRMWTMLPESKSPRRSDGIHNDFSSLTYKILGIFQFAAQQPVGAKPQYL